MRVSHDRTVEIIKQHAGQIHIYPVGLLHDIQMFIHTADRADARLRFRAQLRRPASLLRRGEWNSLRNHLNGYLAEHATLGDRAGHGWTRGRAVRDLARHLAEIGADDCPLCGLGATHGQHTAA